MKRIEACHRFKTCSVNNCPLEEREYFTEVSDNETRCPLPEYDIEKIKERYIRIQNNPIVVPEPEPILISDRMKDENNNLYRMTTEQVRKVNALIRSECCNYDSGKCKLLMDDCISRCPQISAPSVLCAWCREAVIPIAPDLEREIFHMKETVKTTPKQTMKACDVCGKRFKPKTTRAKHCPDCAVKVRRKQWSQSQRKIRSKSTI